MKTLLKLISLAGLLLTIVPSVLIFNGMMEFGDHKNLMLAGTCLWFISAPFWMKEKSL